MLFAERLPVGLVLEELLSLRYFVLVAAVNRFLKTVRLNMVYYRSCHCSALPVAHGAEGMRFEK